MKVKVSVPVLPKDDHGNKPSTSRRASEEDSFVMVEEELEVVEEDAEEEEDERDVMVDYLFEQLREMKEKVRRLLLSFSAANSQVFELEMRNAAIESEVRQEVAMEMQDTIQQMHDEWSKRLEDEVSSLATGRRLTRRSKRDN
jgi:kinesin family protein 20